MCILPIFPEITARLYNNPPERCNKLFFKHHLTAPVKYYKKAQQKNGRKQQRMGCKPKPEDIAGGQAILEGVMMRHGDKIAAAVRRPDREIVFQERRYVPLTKRYKPLGWMFVRGTVSLFEMMIIGIQCLMFRRKSLFRKKKKSRRAGKCMFPSPSALRWPFFSLWWFRLFSLPK